MHFMDRIVHGIYAYAIVHIDTRLHKNLHYRKFISAIFTFTKHLLRYVKMLIIVPIKNCLQAPLHSLQDGCSKSFEQDFH